MVLKLALKLVWNLRVVLKLVGWFGWLKGQRGKLGVKGPLEEEKKDVSHPKTMPLAAGKN